MLVKSPPLPQTLYSQVKAYPALNSSLSDFSVFNIRKTNSKIITLVLFLQVTAAALSMKETSLELVNFVAITGKPRFVVASPCLQRLMERSYNLKGSMASVPPMFRCLVYVNT